MADPQPELSIIIPAFNEEKEIAACVRSVEDKLKSIHVTYEIILVDDGSDDRTLLRMQECTNACVKALFYKNNIGKGFAVRHGMQMAQGKYKLFMDVDLSTSLDSIQEFLECMRQGNYNILIGDRKSRPDDQKTKQPWHRRFLGQGFTCLSHLCVGKPIKDFTCGFKMFDHGSADILFKKQRIFNWAFDTELIYIALVNNLSIGEIPVIWKHHPGSNVRPFKDVFTSLSGLIKIKYNAWNGYYQ